jgi:aerobic-type carbon monoxide dehydrogenase small subunit (CoxS/CutS family)
MLISAEALLRSGAGADEAAVREGLAGNLCRCTGYAGIVAAVLAEATRRTTAPADPPR